MENLREFSEKEEKDICQEFAFKESKLIILGRNFNIKKNLF